MGQRGNLKAVPPGARVKRKTPEKVVDAANMSRRDILVASRFRIASDIDNGVPAHALAPLTRQLLEIDREIRAIDSASKEDDPVASAAATPDAPWEAI